ncbi:hypothetical protein [Hyphomonas sp.]|uniref:hypothetical protein n=1 Tax=Hyphomonas sp. TaxID=87 RepID=UPI003001EFAB
MGEPKHFALVLAVGVFFVPGAVMLMIYCCRLVVFLGTVDPVAGAEVQALVFTLIGMAVLCVWLVATRRKPND